MAQIRKLKSSNTTIYPVTHANAVWVSPSYKLSDFVGEPVEGTKLIDATENIITHSGPKGTQKYKFKRDYVQMYDINKENYFSSNGYCMYLGEMFPKFSPEQSDRLVLGGQFIFAIDDTYDPWQWTDSLTIASIQGGNIQSIAKVPESGTSFTLSTTFVNLKQRFGTGDHLLIGYIDYLEKVT